MSFESRHLVVLRDAAGEDIFESCLRARPTSDPPFCLNCTGHVGHQADRRRSCLLSRHVASFLAACKRSTTNRKRLQPGCDMPCNTLALQASEAVEEEMSLILVMGIRTPHCAKAPKDRRQLLAFRLTALQLVDEADDCSHDENLALPVYLPVYYSDAVARQLPRAIPLPKAYLHGAEAALVAVRAANWQFEG